VAKLFFLTSGEHKSLPISEIQAILKAEEIDYNIINSFTQVVQLETKIKSINAITNRSALTRVCCKEIFNCKAKIQEILDNVNSVIDKFISNESFVVRIRRVKNITPELDRTDLERKIGEQVIKKVCSAKVNLKKPQKTFFGILTDNRFFLGLKVTEIIPKPFSERGPRKKPFFHPTAMQAKLARVMVNLAQPKRGDLVLDPFCGTGGMLIEAGLMGCKVLGFDAKPRMLLGSLKNINHFGVNLQGLVIADARYPPIIGVDCIVTDPPYGRCASTLGGKTKFIVEDFLSVATDLIQRGRKICMASPETVKIGEIAKAAGYKRLESHYVYVHRSLTREIVVLERM
jgi:tRNA (guanine10-N2)-dimethyltransferase